MWLKNGFFLNNFSNGLELLLDEFGRMFRMSAAVIIASHQYDLSSSLSFSMQRVLSTRVRFILSAIPFCSGLYGTVYSCLINFDLQKQSIQAFRYSPPLSLLSTLMFVPDDILIS